MVLITILPKGKIMKEGNLFEISRGRFFAADVSTVFAAIITEHDARDVAVLHQPDNTPCCYHSWRRSSKAARCTTSSVRNAVATTLVNGCLQSEGLTSTYTYEYTCLRQGVINVPWIKGTRVPRKQHTD